MKGKSNVLLVNLVSSGEKDLYPPFGLMFISNALKAKGFRAKIFHEPATSENLKKLCREFEKSFLVGFYTKTSSLLNNVLEASALAKKKGCFVVWGGPHATVLPEKSLEEKDVDFVIVGEGEKPIIELAVSIREKKSFETIKGLGFKLNGKAIVNGFSETIPNLAECKMDWTGLNVERYLKKMENCNRVLPFISSRGCPHRCNFCYNQTVNKRLWRGCNSRETVKDIIFLKKKFGLDGIFFLDDNFFTDKRRALEIISGMGLKFFAEIRADYVNEEFLKKLKEFGCVELYFGAESGSETMLKKMQKDISSGQIETAVRLCNDVGIKPILSFIMFYPNETNRERDETINFILRLLEKYSVQIEGPKLYTPYPGTKFFEECKSMGWVEPETTRDWAMLDRRISINGRSFIKKADYEKYSALLLSMLALIDLYNKEKMQRLLFYPMIALEKARLKKKIGFFPIETRAYFFLKSALARIA